MTDEMTPPKDRPRRPRRHGRIGLGMLSSLAFATLILGFAALSLSGRALPAPEWLRERIEAEIGKRMPEGRFSLGGAELMIGRDGVPRVMLTDVLIGDSAGGGVAELNRLRTRLSPGALLRGEVAASRIVLSGAQITLRRNTDGSFAMQTGAPAGEGVSFGALLEGLDRALGAAPLSSIREVAAAGVVLTLEDARSGRIWQATNAGLMLRRTETGLSISLTSDVFNGTDNVAAVQLSLDYALATQITTIGATLSNAAASDIAVQAPALAWLGVLDAPISGAVRAVVDGDGGLRSLAGTLDIDSGVIRPTEATDPVAFETARAYFSFDPDRRRIDFTEIAMRSEEGTIKASGHTYLSEISGGWPAAYLGQFVVSEASFRGDGFFQAPVALSDMRADVRLRLQPFSVELAQLVIDNDGEPVRARGLVTAEDDGWHVSVDAQTERISPATVTAFWPTRISPVTRRWLTNNVLEGSLTDLSAALRARQGEKPDISLTFSFEDGEVRFMKNLPPVTGGRGRATLIGQEFALVVEEGAVTAANGETIEGGGTVFRVADVRQKPAPGKIDVRARGDLQATLSILDKPPFRVMERAKRPVDIAEGSADIEASVTLPLKNGIKAGDVDYTVTATVSDVRSDALVPGRVLTSPALQVEAAPDGVRIFGPGALDGVEMTADWRQPFGPGAAEAGSTVNGRITLSDEALDVFSIPLPEGMVRGANRGAYTLALKPGERPALDIESDLVGLRLAMPALGWAKGTDVPGTFNVSARLGDVPEVTGLSLDAPGLALTGGIDLGEGGRFAGATFSRLRVADWLDAAVRLTPRGNASPGVTITGGRFDLRRFSRIDRPSGGGGSPIEVRLDRMVVTENVTFAPVVGRIEPLDGGLTGTFEARVNGETPVRGTLAPANGGTAVRLRSANAGGVIRDSGLSPNAEGGSLDLVLTPVTGAAGGTYDGEFLIEDVRVRKAPAMADLLDAISVVGLIDQLDGPGIKFDTVDGRFRLNRDALRLREAAAVGGSLGVSLDGIYDLNARAINMQGVISPIYFVNGIGSLLTRRGEGLFGFNFRVAGTAANPDVSVNPLSILTPGMFRSIFRQDAPGE